MDALTRPFVQAVAERLIEMLEAGVAPWQRPWNAEVAESRLPINPVTENRYKGINALHLMAQGYDDQRWMTYKQAESTGAQVRKGEKGTPIQYWKFTEQRVRQDEEGHPLMDKAGRPEKYTIHLERPALFMATVFNASQIDGLPPARTVQPAWHPMERAELVLQASGARFEHGTGDRAFYHVATDTIHLPGRAGFLNAEDYYATALHELGHWTGHPSRLGRDLSHPFGSEGYAREELRAEIASMLLGEELHIGHDPSQHAAYVGSWIKAIRSDPLEIFRAAADAERIQDYVLNLEQKLQQQPTLDEVNFRSAKMDDTGVLALDLTTAEATVVGQMRYLRREGAVDQATEYRAANLAAFGFELPPEWSGRVKVLETTPLNWGSEQEGQSAHSEWTLIAVLRDSSLQPLASYAVKGDAERMTERLALVDAHAETNEFEKAAKLARFLEAAVQRDPASRPEDVTATREARRTAELKATQNDADLVRRVAEGEKGNEKPVPVSPALPVPGRVEERRPGSRCAPARKYLAVPYGERGLAKATGAKWDRAAKAWYADGGADMAKFSRWTTEQEGPRQGAAMQPREEFAEALIAAGCIISGEHPFMDGKKHRITVHGEGHSENAGSGFYVGHLDGHPAGYIKNNKTGVEVRWKAKGYVLSPEDKAALVAQAANRLQDRSDQQAQAQEVAAERVAKLVANLRSAREPTSYMRSKKIGPSTGALTDGQGARTYLPATDADGKLWTVQVIQADGSKRFPRDSRKAGCFHAVGGLDAVANAPVLLVAEGYATASSLAQAGGFATVAAFDSGNLPAVVNALHKKYPGKPVIVAGDDDAHLEATQGINPGRQKAEEAARSVGGRVLLPVFGPGEQTGSPKDFKDFNDLASKSCLGEEGLSRQLRHAVEQELNKAHSRQLAHTLDDRQQRRHARAA